MSAPRGRSYNIPMKTLALSLLAAAVPAFAEPAASPILAAGAPDAAAQAQLDSMLNGGTHCRAAEIKAIVNELETLPGRESGSLSAGMFNAYCGKKAGVLYFKAKGHIPQTIRESGAAIWLEGANGTVVKNSELPEHLETLAAERRGVVRANPIGAPVMTWEYTLRTDGGWPVQWRLSGASDIVVNQGDFVLLTLQHSQLSAVPYASFEITGVTAALVAQAAGQTTLGFRPDTAGTYPIVSSSARLIVLPR